MSNSSPGEPAAEPGFPVLGDRQGWTGPWAVRHRNPFGRELTSDPRPTLEAATAHARYLRDQRGADVLGIVEAKPRSGPAV